MKFRATVTYRMPSGNVFTQPLSLEYQGCPPDEFHLIAEAAIRKVRRTKRRPIEIVGVSVFEAQK